MGKFNYLPIKSDGWADYQLLDSGYKRKLERFGAIVLDRFEPEATWEPHLKSDQWRTAHHYYHPGRSENAGHWDPAGKSSREWMIELDNLKIALRLSRSRHIGIFPEQLENWRWLIDTIQGINESVKVLNLFAYTGVATLYCALAGAAVTHVDASHSAIEMAKKSQDISQLSKKPVRWIVDDVIKFTQREIRRGNKYHGIILDPPVFGRGPKGEIWKFDEHISKLLSSLSSLLTRKNAFLLLTTYNVPQEPEELARLLSEIIPDKEGAIEYGPLLQIEKSATRELMQSMYVRWRSL